MKSIYFDLILIVFIIYFFTKTSISQQRTAGCTVCLCAALAICIIMPKLFKKKNNRAQLKILPINTILCMLNLKNSKHMTCQYCIEYYIISVHPCIP